MGECLSEVGLFKHSPLVTAPCLLAGDNFFLGDPPHHTANTDFQCMFLYSPAPVGDVLQSVRSWASVVEAASSICPVEEDFYLQGLPLPPLLEKGILPLPLIPNERPPLLNEDVAWALCAWSVVTDGLYLAH